MSAIATQEPVAVQESDGRPRLARAGGFVALAIVLLLLAPSAQAAPAQLWTKCDTAEPAGQQCSIPRAVAANPLTGQVFLADQVNRRVVVFNAAGQFLRAWGWDVIASGPGDDTVAPEDEFEICVPEEGDVCKAGVQGSGAGQLAAPQGVSLDSAGSVYVADKNNERVQKFNRAGEFELMFGGDVNKTKVEALAPEAQRNRCPVDPGDECQQGTQGTGQGQFGSWTNGSFIAAHTAGTATLADDSVFVGDVERIQRFDAAGAYQDECAVSGTVQGLAVDSAGDLYRSGGTSIRKLSYSTPACEDVTPPEGFAIPKLGAASPDSSAVAVDPAGSVYAFGPVNPGLPTDPIFKFDPTGKLVEQFGAAQFSGSTGLATNLCPGSEAPGNLYVSNSNQANGFIRAYGTAPSGCGLAITGEATAVEETTTTVHGTVNPNGLPVEACAFEYGLTAGPYEHSVPCAESLASLGEGSEPLPVHADLAGLPAGAVHHYRVTATSAAGTERGADRTFKTKGPPVISDEHLQVATDTEATLKALVNPEGFQATYHVEYVSEAGFQASGFEAAQSTPAVPTGKDRTDHPAIARLHDLLPDTTYHWRVVAANASGTTESEDHQLTTYPVFAPQTDCPNQAFRSGPSGPLPDCRAYEMVSPVDKNGGDIVNGLSSATPPESGGYIQATPEGDKITYTSGSSFAGQPNSFRFNQYLAERGESGEGWASEGVHPPVTGKINALNPGFNREFTAFTADLCSAWLIDHQTPPPSSDGQEGLPNLFRRDNCEPGTGLLEALVPAPPTLPEGTSSNYVGNGSVQGISGDGRHALFTAKAQLPHVPEAAPGNNDQIYDRFEGGLSLVSVLPNGSTGDPAPADGKGFASPGNSAVGSTFSRGNLQGAVSEDGSFAYWTAGGESGAIYLREYPEQGIVADECEGANACTHRVSEGSNAFFWQGSADGARALYGEQIGASEDLYLFDLARLESEAASPTKIASGALGVLGADEDLSHVYFASREAIAGTGGLAGEPNLYLYQEGAEGGEASYELVATVAEGDVGQLEPGAVLAAYDLTDRLAIQRAVRVSPDGTSLAFNSRAPLTAYDNTDPTAGKPAVEVYLFDAEAGELHCVSCNPSGARPQAALMSQPYARPEEAQPTGAIAAAWIPTWEHPNHASNVLSADGGRLFFNAADPLLPRDTNGAQDVYQWEAPGTGGCSTSSPSYFPQNSGCLDLISSGDSPHESLFSEASADGEDVFFTTASSLLPQDPGLVDLYDARAGGGFPQPTPVPDCDGEACQPAPAPLRDPTPASAAFRGPGDPRAQRDCGVASRRAAKLSRGAKRLRRAAQRSASAKRSRRLQRRSAQLRKRASGLARNAKRCRRANGRAGR